VIYRRGKAKTVQRMLGLETLQERGNHNAKIHAHPTLKGLYIDMNEIAVAACRFHRLFVSENQSLCRAARRKTQECGFKILGLNI